MHKVFLFGSNSLYSIPEPIQTHISNILKETNGEVEFIVGDAGGVDSGFHQVLSALGGRHKTQIYCMDYARNNKFELPVKTFKTTYDVNTKRVSIFDENDNLLDEVLDVLNESDIKNTRQYYEFKDRQMCKDCTFAICFWDGKSRVTFNNITRLKAQNKYVYVYQAQI